MKRKLFGNFLLIGVLVTVLSCGLLLAMLFQHYERQAFAQLERSAEYIAQGMELSGGEYLETLPEGDRVTWVDSDGAVLYDSQADPAEMENHLNREEIIQALAEGSGQSSHYSETLLERTLYYAVLLKDGSVLRVSCTRETVMAMMLWMLFPLGIIVLLVLLVCILLASRLSQNIVRPINQIDLDQPKVEEIYPEFEPLVNRIRQQNCTIHSQMEELGRKQQEFAAITENLSEGFLLCDSKYNVLSCNRIAMQLLHLPESEPLILSRKDCGIPVVIDAVDAAFAGGRTEKVIEINGRSWQMLSNPVSADGQVIGMVVLLLDVTEQQQREELRREFSANVSHELKTPLTSISGFAELMKAGLVPEEKMREFAADIYKESQRLIGLVKDIIRLSQLDQGEKLFETETVDLYDMAEDVLDSLRAVAEQQDVRLTLSGEYAKYVGVWQILNEMLFNLCDNAIKYNVPGGSVDVSVRRAGTHLRVTVRDTGIGIPYEDQSRVFERFYRVDKSRSKAVGGTGLGLSIVKHGALYHNAKLELESEPGKGTAISIVF